MRITTNTFADAEGYGDVTVGGLLLKDVWYVPMFGSTRLVSIGVTTLYPELVSRRKGKLTL